MEDELCSIMSLQESEDASVNLPESASEDAGSSQSASCRDGRELAFERSASEIRSCIASTLVQMASAMQSSSRQSVESSRPTGHTVAAMLQEAPELKSSLKHIGSRYLQDATSLYHVAGKVFKQNCGPQALRGQRPDVVNLEQRSASVSELRYTHDMISPTFRHGKHSGEPITNLVEQLGTGKVLPSEVPSLVVAPLMESFMQLLGIADFMPSSAMQRTGATTLKFQCKPSSICVQSLLSSSCHSVQLRAGKVCRYIRLGLPSRIGPLHVAYFLCSPC